MSVLVPLKKKTQQYFWVVNFEAESDKILPILVYQQTFLSFRKFQTEVSKISLILVKHQKLLFLDVYQLKTKLTAHLKKNIQNN